MRRAVAAVSIVIVVILLAVGVHSCQVSQRNSSLKDYNDNVAALIGSSEQTSHRFFNLLTGGQASGGGAALQDSINQTRLSADNQLSRARGFEVPSEVQGAQQTLLLALRMRRDGIANVARQIQPALTGSTSGQAVNAIAAEMARLYSSDAIYKDYTLPGIIAALRGANIHGEQYDSDQFVPDIRWLDPAFVAGQLHANAPAAGKPAPGTHGHSLTSVAVGGTTLQAGTTNTIPANPPPTFDATFSNTGQNNETNVTVKVAIAGSSVTGQTTVPQTMAGQSYTAKVTLASPPPAGNYNVTVTIAPVPGEKNTANNSLTFPVTFQ